MKDNLYHYKAFVTKVYDGDTITVDIDLGLNIVVKEEKIRLHRINAPEVKGKEKSKGIKSRDYLAKLLLEKPIVLKTIKDKKGKFGRYIGEIYLEDLNGELKNINDLIVKEGFAKYQEY